ncbi:MAG TPA: hypothetical protein VGB30_14490 [bacterium]
MRRDDPNSHVWGSLWDDPNSAGTNDNRVYATLLPDVASNGDVWKQNSEK